MKHIRTEKQTTPIGQEIEYEWFSGTPEEAEKMLRDGECEWLEVSVDGVVYYVFTETDGGLGITFTSKGEDAVSKKQAASLAEFINGRKFDFSPANVLTI